MKRQSYQHTLPARILHWVTAVGMGLLIVTGLYIRDPAQIPLFANMDMARKIHFIVMYIVIYAAMIRIYYSYISKDYQELLFRMREIKEIPDLLKYYFFLGKSIPCYGKYNPGQKLLYNMWILLLFLQSLSGFMLYWPDLFARLTLGLGGPLMVRQIHFLLTWGFTVTISLHIYLAFLSGWAVVRSMVTGYLPEACTAQSNSMTGTSIPKV